MNPALAFELFFDWTSFLALEGDLALSGVVQESMLFP